MKGATTGAAASILSGAALVSTPVTALFGLVTLGTTVAVAMPVVLACAAAGAVATGAMAAYSTHGKIKGIDERFNELNGNGPQT